MSDISHLPVFSLHYLMRIYRTKLLCYSRIPEYQNRIFQICIEYMHTHTHTYIHACMHTHAYIVQPSCFILTRPSISSRSFSLAISFAAFVSPSSFMHLL